MNTVCATSLVLKWVAVHNWLPNEKEGRTMLSQHLTMGARCTLAPRAKAEQPQRETMKKKTNKKRKKKNKQMNLFCTWISSWSLGLLMRESGAARCVSWEKVSTHGLRSRPPRHPEDLQILMTVPGRVHIAEYSPLRRPAFRRPSKLGQFRPCFAAPRKIASGPTSSSQGSICMWHANRLKNLMRAHYPLWIRPSSIGKNRQIHTKSRTHMGFLNRFAGHMWIGPFLGWGGAATGEKGAVGSPQGPNISRETGQFTRMVSSYSQRIIKNQSADPNL